MTPNWKHTVDYLGFEVSQLLTRPYTHRFRAGTTGPMIPPLRSWLLCLHSA